MSEKNPLSRGYLKTLTGIIGGVIQKYKEVLLGTSVGVLSAIADLFLGAVEDGEPLLVHLAKHGPTSLHMVEHYFFVLGGFGVGYVWWRMGSEHRKLSAMMAELEESEAKYRDIFENVGDMVCVLNPNGEFAAVNKRVEEVLGYSRQELVGMSFREVVSSNSIRKIEKLKERLERGETVLGAEIEFVANGGKRGFGELHCTAKYRGGRLEGVRCIIIDITERRRAEEEARDRLMKYRIERGRISLLKERKLDLALDIFQDAISSGWEGAAISRAPPERLREVCGGKTPLLEVGKGERTSNLPELKKAIENELSESEIVLLDRLDYLITKNGFEATLKFLHELGDLFYAEGRTLLLSIDPNTLAARELALLEKETATPIPKQHLAIPAELYSLLRFIYSENAGGKAPSYKDVGSRFGITKPTTRKRIRELRGRGYVVEVKRGRTKVLELSEKGKELF